jgi:hypothetical protein
VFHHKLELTFYNSSSWKKTNRRVVEKGTSKESYRPSHNAFLGVKESALPGVGFTGKRRGLLDENSAVDDEDVPEE